MKSYLSSLNRLFQITSYLWLITVFNQSAHSITLRLQTSPINKSSLLSEEYILGVQEGISIQPKVDQNTSNIKNVKFISNEETNEKINKENKLSQAESVVSGTNINTCQGENNLNEPSVDLGAGVILLPQVKYSNIFKGIYDYEKIPSCDGNKTNDINSSESESEIIFGQFTIDIELPEYLNDKSQNQILENDHKDIGNYNNLGIRENFLEILTNFDSFDINNSEIILSQEEKLEFIKSKYGYLNGYNFKFESSQDSNSQLSEVQEKLRERLQKQLEKQQEKQEKLQEKIQEKIEKDQERQAKKKEKELEKKEKQEQKKKEKIQKEYQ